MADLLALPLRRFRPKRYRPGNLGTWSGHLPFANDLIWEHRPRLLVELGTHYGESYFGFCQAVQESGAGTRCFAVDTWRGDEHAGFYGEDVFADVASYNASAYNSFSTLVQGTFDSAISEFEPNSIDLLHIDGLHTYSAVRHDFETWLPKVKPGGIVLLHDITVRHADFEVWRLWEELRKEFEYFEFHHWWGLGVIRKPAETEDTSSFLKMLFEPGDEKAEKIRTLYQEAAELLDYRERSPVKTQAAADANRPYLQVFPGIAADGFAENSSIVSNLEPGTWQTHILDLSSGLSTGPIRVDPVNRPAWIEISEVRLSNQSGGESFFVLRDAQELSQLRCGGQLMAMGQGETAQFFSWSDDPQLFIDLPPGTPRDVSLRLEIAMRVEFDLEPVRDALALQPSPVEAELARAQIAALQAQISRDQDRHVRLEWDLAFARTQIAHKSRESANYELLLSESEIRGEHLARFLSDLRAEVLENDAELLQKTIAIRDLESLAQSHQSRMDGIVHSLSWRATAFLRRVAEPLMRRRSL